MSALGVNDDQLVPLNPRTFVLKAVLGAYLVMLKRWALVLAVVHVASSLDRVWTSKLTIGVTDSDHSTSTMVGLAPNPIEGMKGLLAGKSKLQSSQR